MPSDVKREAQASGAPSTPQVEPPSAKLIVRLFLIPALIVAAAVGIMLLIGRMAGGEPSLEEALSRLKHPGGGRTTDYLVGPASKQRYMDAKALTDKMKQGMAEADRIKLSHELSTLLTQGYVRPEEGEVQHFVLLALGRVWQIDPRQGKLESLQAQASRQEAITTLIQFASAKEVSTRKAAALAPAFWRGYEQTDQVLPVLASKLKDSKEDLDVRLAAATTLGFIGNASNPTVVDALKSALREEDPRNSELVWMSAVALSELGLPDGQDTVLKLLDRKELSQLQYYDRETDPKNPAFRPLGEEEQQRYLINTMEAVKNLKSPAITAKLKQLAETDPSQRVQWEAKDVLRSPAQ